MCNTIHESLLTPIKKRIFPKTGFGYKVFRLSESGELIGMYSLANYAKSPDGSIHWKEELSVMDNLYGVGFCGLPNKSEGMKLLAKWHESLGGECNRYHITYVLCRIKYEEGLIKQKERNCVSIPLSVILFKKFTILEEIARKSTKEYFK